jgi:hypothetical protein
LDRLLGRLKGLGARYQQGDLFERVRNATRSFLKKCATASTSWHSALNSYRGDEEVPLMTITKTKGLEYDVIVLLSLDDSDWWLPEESRRRTFDVLRRGLACTRTALYDVLQGPADRKDRRNLRIVRGCRSQNGQQRQPYRRSERAAGEYAAGMEDLLDLYAEAPDPKRPIVCFDERSSLS